MTDQVKAKFMCQSVTTYSATSKTRRYEFMAVYDTSVPEDRRYATATPFATLVMNVDNPAVSFKPGVAYYLTFEAAE